MSKSKLEILSLVEADFCLICAYLMLIIIPCISRYSTFVQCGEEIRKQMIKDSQ